MSTEYQNYQPELSNIVTKPTWTDWPTASPTSSLGINVRFYTTVDEDDGSILRMDIGEEQEAMLEQLYTARGMAEQLPAIPIVDYEKHIRTLYQTRLDASHTYTLHMARYIVLTGDIREVRRALNREQASVVRTLRLFPFRLHAGLSSAPVGFQERSKRFFAYLWVRLQLLFVQ